MGFTEPVIKSVAVRTTVAVVSALLGVVLLALISPVASVLNLANTTALIMGGTGQPLSTPPNATPYVQQYMGMAVNNYIAPASTANPDTGIPPGPYNPVAVITPAEFGPDNGSLTFDQSVAMGLTNLVNCINADGCEYNQTVGSAAPSPDDSFVVFGYSQSSTIATLVKRSLAAQYPNGGGPDVSFVLTANGNRPNGGFLARGPRGLSIPLPLPYGGVTFSGPTPTNTQYETVDVAAQYDFWADNPVNPLNFLAMANAYVSTVHYNYDDAQLNDGGVVYQGQHGDTTYYMLPTRILPLLQPIAQIPFIGFPLADALDAPLRVLVEAGYDRRSSPGQPMPWNPLYFPDPVAFAVNLIVAIPTGLDNALEDVVGVRLLGTQRPGPYGVGGPKVTLVDPPETAETSQVVSDTESADVKTPKTLDDVAQLVRSAIAPPSETEKPAAKVTTDDSRFGHLTPLGKRSQTEEPDTITTTDDDKPAPTEESTEKPAVGNKPAAGPSIRAALDSISRNLRGTSRSTESTSTSTTDGAPDDAKSTAGQAAS